MTEEEEIIAAWDSGDFLPAAQLARRGGFSALADRIERMKPHPRLDPEKAERDQRKATFKAIYDFLRKERSYPKDEAFDRAIAIVPLDIDVACDIADGKRREITDLSCGIPRLVIEELCKDSPGYSGGTSRRK
jgi:hypothetical protein